jgi:F-type H+-transporting ATPase subunit b
MDFLKEINWQLVITQILCFIAVLAVLRWKLWGPTFKILEDRREKIAAELKSIENAKAEVARLKSDYDEHLAKIEQEAKARFQEVARQAEDEGRATREKARVDAEQIIADSRKEMQFEFLRVKDALKVEVVDMVLKTTEKMLQEKLTMGNDRKIIESMLEQLNTTNEK